MNHPLSPLSSFSPKETLDLNPNLPQSSSDSKPNLAEDYSTTFHRLLEEKEAIIEDLLLENQRLSQQNPPKQPLPLQILSPHSLISSPNKDIAPYKQIFDLETQKTQLERQVSVLQKGGNIIDKGILTENELLKKKVFKLNQELWTLSRRCMEGEEGSLEGDIPLEAVSLQGEITRLKSREEHYIQEIERLSQLNQESSQSSMGSSGNRAKRELDLVKAVNEGLETRVSELMGKERLLEHRIEVLLSEKEDFIKENDGEYIQELRKRVLQLESEVFGLTGENSQLKGLKKGILFDLETIKLENRDLKGEIMELSKERDLLKEEGAFPRKEEVLNELNGLREVIEALRREKQRVSKALKLDLDEKTRKSEDLLLFIKELEAKNQSLLVENDSLLNQTEYLIKENKSLIASKELLLNDQKVVLKELIKEKDSLFDENTYLIGQNKEKTLEKEILTSEIESFRKELREKAQQTRYFQEEIQSNLLLIDSLELRLKEQEILLKDLHSGKELLEEKFNEERAILIENLSDLKGELMIQKETFNEVLGLQESHLVFLKERYIEDIRDLLMKFNKSPEKDINKVLEGYKETSFVLSHKEAKIKQLNDKLKAFQKKGIKSNGKTMKGSSYNIGNLPIETLSERGSFLQISRMESQIYSLQLEARKLKEEGAFLKEMNESLENKVNSIKESKIALEKELLDRQKQYKSDINEALLKNQQFSTEQKSSIGDQEENIALFEQLKEADQALTQTKEEIIRKNHLLQGLKLEKEDLQANLQKAQEQIQRLAEELDKGKKVSREGLRKDLSYKAFQEKLDQSKASEKLWVEEKASLNERLKGLKTDLVRKEGFNRELKEKLEQALCKLEGLKGLYEENERLKEGIKRARGELERKETSLGLLKGKLDELENNNNSNMTQNNRIKEKQSDNQEKKLEIMKNSLKKSENQVKILGYLIKRLFRETISNVQRLKSRIIQKSGSTNNKGFDERNLTESLNILKLSPQELEEFLEPGKGNQEEKEDWLMERFEKEVEQEDFNMNGVYGMIKEVIEERVRLEKTV